MKKLMKVTIFYVHIYKLGIIRRNDDKLLKKKEFILALNLFIFRVSSTNRLVNNDKMRESIEPCLLMSA